MELKNIFGHHADCEVVQKREAGGKAAIVKPKAGPVLGKSYVVQIVRQSYVVWLPTPDGDHVETKQTWLVLESGVSRRIVSQNGDGNMFFRALPLFWSILKDFHARG